MANEQVPQDPRSENGNLLNAFLASAANFVTAISSQILAVVPEGTDKIIIKSTTESLVAQMDKLIQYVQTTAAPLTQGQRRQVDQFLSVQDGIGIANRTVAASATVFASIGGDQGGQVTLGFFDWLQKNIQLIKKILHRILDLLSHIFGFTLPEWVTELIEILDEIFSLVVTLLGGSLGFRTSQIAESQSNNNVHFLHERAALAKWDAAIALRQRPTDEEA